MQKIKRPHCGWAVTPPTASSAQHQPITLLEHTGKDESHWDDCGTMGRLGQAHEHLSSAPSPWFSIIYLFSNAFLCPLQQGAALHPDCIIRSSR